MALSDQLPKVILPLGFTAGIFYFGNKIFKKLDEKSEADKAHDKKVEDLLNLDVWNMSLNTYAPAVYKAAKLKNPSLTWNSFLQHAGYWTAADAKEINKKIDILYNAKSMWATVILTAGIVHDQDNQVLGVFTQCPTKVYIAFLNAGFYNKYKRSLIDYLNSFMDDKNIERIKTIVDKKPLW